KIVFLFPNSDTTPDARLNIQKMLNANQDVSLNIKKDIILDAIDRKRSAKSYRDTYFDFLSFLYETNVKELHPILLNEIKRYFRIFSDNPVNGDIITFFAGSTLEQEENITNAIACYRKIIALFPESPYRWKAQYQIGYLFYSRLDSVSSAMDNFLEVINSFPMPEEAVSAQFYLAEIYDKKLNNIDEAIQNYRLLIGSFPDNPFILPALQRTAELCRNSGRYEEAVTAYMQIFEDYPDCDTAPSALEQIISIYYNHLNKPARAAETLKLFGSYFKNYPKADEYLFKAAAIYANELKMMNEAQEICVFIIKNYPDGHFAEPARDLMKKGGN
ncbi:MAG: tol-pal system YbgF family protein, partial [Calditrichaceae bacterium]